MANESGLSLLLLIIIAMMVMRFILATNRSGPNGKNK